MSPKHALGIGLDDELEFRRIVYTAQGQIKAGIDGINDRLDKLNGSVARHDGDIAALKTAEAVRVGVAAATEKQADRWYDRLKPLLGPLAGAVLALLLANGPKILGR